MTKTELPESANENLPEQIAPERSSRSISPAPMGVTLFMVIVGVTAGYFVTRWFDSGTPPTYMAYLTADSTTISTIKNVIIEEIMVKEGDSVEKGTDLFTFSKSNSSDDIQEYQRQISVIDEKIASGKSKAKLETSWRLKQIDAEIHRENIALTNLYRAEFDTKIERDIREDVLKKQSPPLRQAIQPDHVFKPAKWVTSSPDEDRLKAILKYNAIDNSLQVMATQIGLHEDRIAALKKLKSELPDQILASQGIAELEQHRKRLIVKVDHPVKANQIETKKANTYGIVRKIHCRNGANFAKGETAIEFVNPEHRFIVVQISRADLQYFSTGREVEIDFGERRPYLGKVRANNNPVPSTQSLGDDTVSVVIEPTGKPWPQVALGTPLHVTPNR